MKRTRCTNFSFLSVHYATNDRRGAGGAGTQRGN